jgi:glycosyltransferase involved in cell wall biosynthesis
MRLAFFSPFHPQPSGISDYSEEILPYLARYAELDIFFDAPPTNQKLVQHFAAYPIAQFSSVQQKQTRRYATCLYQMGNSTFHSAIYETLRQYPGITVLHEHLLHNFFLTTTGGEGNWAGYWRELAYNTNPAFMNNVPPATPVFSPSLPLAQRVIDLSLGLIVHSRDMARRVLRDAPRARVAVVPMGMPLGPPPVDRDEQAAIRLKLDLSIQPYIVGIFGQLSHHKRVEVVLQAFARLRQQQQDAVCLVVGRNIGEYDIPYMLRKLGLDSSSVVVTGYVSQEALGDYIRAVDTWVNLRYPTYGETSAATLRLMAHGKPVIVSDVATFADLPDIACVKVGVNAAEVELLYQYLLFLAQRPEVRERLGVNAWHYIQNRHAPDKVARQMIEAVKNILAAVEKGDRRGYLWMISQQEEMHH